MHGVRLDVEHADSGDREERRPKGVDRLPVPALGEIGDALYEGSQTAPPATVWMTRFTPT